MKELFVSKNFRQDTIDLIFDANAIISAYAEQGYTLTLRQLYYQFVARDAFPEDRRWQWTGAKWIRDPKGTKNAQPNYKWLGSVINDARLAGMVDWLAIEDRTRNVERNACWDNAAAACQAVHDQFRLDLWERQPVRVEVWIEKEALIGVIADVCQRLDVPFFACRGYVSQSEAWRAYHRSMNHELVILHLGDHDPSGIDMTRDNDERLFEVFGGVGELHRLALNMNQIIEHKPPPSPAKVTDSRWRDYCAEFGNDSWELDALEPAVINKLIETNVARFRDDNLWNEAVEEQEEERAKISDAILMIEG